MTARFALTRTSDAAERIIARHLGGADIAFASRREPFACRNAAPAAGEPLPDREGSGLVGGAQIHSCHVCAESWHGGFVSGPCGWRGCPLACVEPADSNLSHAAEIQRV